MRWFLAVCMLGLPACKLSEIVVAVGSDLPVPALLDRVSVRVDRQSEQLALSWDLGPGRFELPGTLGLLPGGSLETPVLVTVSGWRGEQAIAERRARLPFASGRVLLLQMNLLARCQRVDCGKDRTCAESGCVPVEQTLSLLPDYDPGRIHNPAPVDRSAEGVFVDGPRGDARQLADGRADGKPDAPRADGPRPDGPRPDAPKADAPMVDAPKADAPKADAPKADVFMPDGPKPDGLCTSCKEPNGTQCVLTCDSRIYTCTYGPAPGCTCKNGGGPAVDCPGTPAGTRCGLCLWARSACPC